MTNSNENRSDTPSLDVSETQTFKIHTEVGMTFVQLGGVQ